MRILTNSPFTAKGLVSIVEAGENEPQNVVFCIPIDLGVAERMRDIVDFENYFSKGISTKIKGRHDTTIIYLDYISPLPNKPDINPLPKFVANVRGHRIDFNLSPLNFLSDNRQRLNIDFFYAGNYLSDELYNKRLVILEPNWRQLDGLFLEEKILFADWK